MERWARQFHSEIIDGCGNATLILVAGALERLWATQSEAWTYRVTHAHEAPGSQLREQGLHEHVAIADAIEAGDAELAEKLLRAHVGNPQIYQVRKRGARVRATDVSWKPPLP